MQIDGKDFQSIWLTDQEEVRVIDQRSLPHELRIETLNTVEEAAAAIKDMHVRGAPLIGVTAAFGMFIAARNASLSKIGEELARARELLSLTRPTAVNLHWALEAQQCVIESCSEDSEIEGRLKANAIKLWQEDIELNKAMGRNGLGIIRKIARENPGRTLNILTHCNAGWLATVDWGTATAPIYMAHNEGIPVHVWVDETRPRNQGARLTAWELGQHGVPHTVIVDNTGGHLMQHGLVDMVITGTDRTTRTGDVANKIGTYLKALAAKDNQVPFYVALPSPTIDWEVRDGIKEIPIEQRGPEEVTRIWGLHNGERKEVLLTPAHSPAANYAFDVTPARLVTGLITERGICEASEQGLLDLFPEKA